MTAPRALGPSHLPGGRGSWYLLALGHSWAGWWAGPSGSLIIHRAAIAWMLAHGRQGHQHMPRQGTSSHNTVHRNASLWAVLVLSKGAESHSQAKPLPVRQSLHRP